MSDEQPVDPASYRTIRLDVDGGVATLTLNRPDHLNAMTRWMFAEMLDALDRVDGDPEIRVLVVTGEGRAFCAGADMSTGAETFSENPQPGESASGGSGSGGSKSGGSGSGESTSGESRAERVETPAGRPIRSSGPRTRAVGPTP